MDNWLEKIRKSIVESFQQNAKALFPASNYNEIVLLFNDATMAHNRGEYEEAIAIYSKILKFDPEYVSALQQRVACYIALGKHESALADINTVMRFLGSNAININWRGMIYLKLEMYQSALADFSHLIDVAYERTKLDTHRYRATCAYHVDKTLAIHDYTYLIEMEEDEVQRKHDYINRGYVYFMLGDFDTALDDFMSAIKIDKDYAYAYRRCIDVYMHRKQYDKALEAINKCLEIEPDTSEHVMLKATILTLLKRFDDAVATFQYALELNPKDYIVYNNIAFFLYSRTGEFEKALSHVNIAIERHEPQAAYFDTRAQIYWLMGDYEKALVDFEFASQLEKRGLCLAGQAITYQAMGNDNKALDLWKQAIELDDALADPSTFADKHSYTPAYVEAAHKLAKKAEKSDN